MRQKGCDYGHNLGRSPLSCLLSHVVPHPQVGWTGWKGLCPLRAASSPFGLAVTVATQHGGVGQPGAKLSMPLPSAVLFSATCPRHVGLPRTTQVHRSLAHMPASGCRDGRRLG